MPFLDDEQTIYEDSDRFAMNNANISMMNQAGAQVDRQDRGLLANIAGYTGLGALDLVDTVASSIPILSRSLGLERGTVNSAALSALDMPGLSDFYNDNRAGLEVGSGIMGIIGAELVTRKFTKPAGALMGALKSVPGLRRVATLDAEYNNAMRVVRLADREIARRGALGMEQYVGRVFADGLPTGLIQTGSVTTRAGAVTAAKRLGFAKGARHAVFTEAVMATTLNQNGFLYQDDMAHNIAWMALGVGVSGAFDRIATAYQIRKFVNSDEIRRTFANALDPDQTEDARLMWHGRKVAGLAPKEQAEMNVGFMGGSFTDYVTNVLVGERTLADTELAPGFTNQSLRQNRASLAVQHEQLAHETIQKVTQKGISTNGLTRFNNETPGAWNHLTTILKRDPAAMYGVEQLGHVPDKASAFELHQAHFSRLNALAEDTRKQIDEALESGDEAFDFDRAGKWLQRIETEKKLVPTFWIDGEAATLSDARVFDGWTDLADEIGPAAKVAGDDNRLLWEIRKSDRHPGGLGVDSNMNVYTPGNKKVNDLDHYDMLNLYRVAQKAIQGLKDTARVINLPNDANWFQIDMAEALSKASGGKVKVNWGEGFSREQALTESIAQKAEYLRDWQKKIEGNPKIDPQDELHKLRVRLNLPRLTAYERGVLGTNEHPVEQLLRGAADYDPAEIRKMSYTELMKTASEFKRLGDFAPTAPMDFQDMMGGSFRFLLDDQGNPTKVLMGYRRNLNPLEWSPDVLADRLAMERIQTIGKLTEGDTLTSMLSRALIDSPDYDTAARTHELMETQVQGSLAGFANQSVFGAATSALKPRDWKARDNPILLAAARQKETAERITRDMFQRDTRQLSEVTSQLDSPRNAGSKLLLNQFREFRPGWDIVDDTATKPGMHWKDGLEQVTLKNGKTGFKFKLANTETNRARWEQTFGSPMPRGANLTAPNGTEVVLDELGVQFMDGFMAVSDNILQNKNQMLKAMGLREINRQHLYVPPPNIDGKFIGFTLDAEGNTVPGWTIIANTEAQFKKEQAELIQRMTDQGKEGWRFFSRDQIERFSNVWDRAQMDFIDPGTTAIQPGKKAGGGLQGMDIDMNGVEGILNTLRSQYFNHSRDVINALYRDQIRSAGARAKISAVETRTRAGFFRDQQFRSVHDMYLEAIQGKSPLQSSGSLVGRFYNQIEGTIDQFLAAGTPGAVAAKAPFAKVWHATNEWFNKAIPWDTSAAAKKDFESLTQALGPHMPFKSAAEFIEAKGAGSLPPTLAGGVNKLNQFTATVMLRVMEPAMAVMNLAGMVNAMPAVIRNVTMREGETVEEFAKRVGHTSTIFQKAGPNDESMGVVDMGKIMSKAFKRAWSKESHADFDYMRSMGYLTQDVAEFHKQFGAIETKSDWNRFFTGDPNSNSAFAKKGLIGWMSILTDKSEDFSRSWGHMAGLEVADILGIEGRAARNGFAHDFANKMIANYSPHNRPEVFQGALGASIGLFQSFIMNYYQRLFRYVETKNYQALGTQMAMQGSLFGVTTLPGYQEAAGLFFALSHGEDDMNAAIHNKVPQSLADVLYAGTLSNIPKLFGLDAVDLYSRGDTQVRLPVTPIALSEGTVKFNMPGVTMMTKIFDGVSQGMKALSAKNPNLTGQQIAEVLANMMPNRPLAGLIEQVGTGGLDTDRYGQVVSETESYAESAYRVLGLRSMRQSRETESFYANKSQQEYKAAADDILNLSTRAALRAGDFDSVPQIFEQYVENGGDPRYFRRWLKGAFMSATSSRAEAQLRETLKNPAKFGQAMRLLDSQVSIGNDHETTGYDEALENESNFDHVNEDMVDYDGGNTASYADPMFADIQ